MKLIQYGPVRTSLGAFLVAATKKGVVRVALPGERRERFLADLKRQSPGARIVPGRGAVAGAGRALAASLQGKKTPIALDVTGTAFQRSVWRALQRIPFGRTATYGEVARRVGRSRAARAVGMACNRNPVPILVPCHRVVGSHGSLGGYGGGIALKRRLLAGESRASR